LEWGTKRANEWLITMILSFGQSILVIDPLKVFLITAIISFLIRRPYDDETLDYNDPFTGALLVNDDLSNVDGHDFYTDANVKGKFRNNIFMNIFFFCVVFRNRTSTSCAFA